MLQSKGGGTATRGTLKRVSILHLCFAPFQTSRENQHIMCHIHVQHAERRMRTPAVAIDPFQYDRPYPPSPHYSIIYFILFIVHLTRFASFPRIFHVKFLGLMQTTYCRTFSAGPAPPSPVVFTERLLMDTALMALTCIPKAIVPVALGHFRLQLAASGWT